MIATKLKKKNIYIMKLTFTGNAFGQGHDSAAQDSVTRGNVQKCVPRTVTSYSYEIQCSPMLGGSPN